MFRIAAIAVLVALPFFNPWNAHAEVIHLDSGESIEGELLEMKGGIIKVRHEILGDIELPRNRVRAIIVGDPVTGKAITPDGKDVKPETPKEVIERMTNPNFGPGKVKDLERGAKRLPTPQDVVEQLRREGVDPVLKDQLHMMLPGFGAPKVQDYFNGSVQGLMNGSLSINDIRDDAINARDQLQQVMDDLGPDAVALQGYFGILDNFIKKTAPHDQRMQDGTKPKLSPRLRELQRPPTPAKKVKK